MERGAGNEKTLAGLLGAAVSTGLACAMLGAFGGCSVDLSRVILPQNAPWFMPIGLAAGFMIGLALGASDYRRSGPMAMRRLPFARPLLFGVAWLAVSVAFYRTVAESLPVDSIPVSQPIRLDRAGALHTSFTAAFTSEYNVELDLKKRIPVQDLTAFLDSSEGSSGSKGSKKAPLARPEIEWTVGGVNPEHQHALWHSSYYGDDSVGLRLGRFDAVKGRGYALTVTVRKPSPDIQVTDPHLRISLGDLSRLRLHPMRMFAAMGSMLSGLIAAGLMVSGLVKWLGTLRAGRRVPVANGAE